MNANTLNIQLLAMYATFAGYLDEGSEVICIEPFFDQYIVRNSKPKKNQ